MPKAFTYLDEGIEELTLAQLKRMAKKPVWIRITNPTSEKLQILSRLTRIPLHELSVDVKFTERPKYEASANVVQITYKRPHMEDEQLVTIPLHLYLVNNIIVTVEKKPSKVLDDLASQLETHQSRFMLRRPISYAIYYILDKINDDYLGRVENIAEKLEVFEKDLNFSKNDLETIYSYSIALTYFNQALVANLEVLTSLKKSDFRLFTRQDREKFTDVYDEARHVLDTQKMQGDIIATLIKLQNSITQQRMNMFIKRLTAITVVLMVPTLITGIYGMNFQFIPLAQHLHGFFITIIGIALITFVLAWVFAKGKWF